MGYVWYALYSSYRLLARRIGRVAALGVIAGVIALAIAWVAVSPRALMPVIALLALGLVSLLGPALRLGSASRWVTAAFAGVVGLSLLLYATGGGTSSGSPATASSSAAGGALAGGSAVPDAGSILTADMAASVIGGTPAKVDVPSLPMPLTTLASYATSAGDTVTLVFARLPGVSGAPALRTATNHDLDPVGGIGDAAGKAVFDRSAEFVFATGDMVVLLDASSVGASGGDLESRLEHLAQQIIDKL